VYLLDREGKPARPGIQSMDSRAADIIDEWNQRGLDREIFSLYGAVLWPAQPNALLAWIKTPEPEVYARIGSVLYVKIISPTA
jgi:L-xylulokinase